MLLRSLASFLLTAVSLRRANILCHAWNSLYVCVRGCMCVCGESVCGWEGQEVCCERPHAHTHEHTRTQININCDKHKCTRRLDICIHVFRCMNQVYVCMYVHTYEYMYGVCAYLCVCVCVFVWAFVCWCVCWYVCMHACMHKLVRVLVCMYAYVHA